MPPPAILLLIKYSWNISCGALTDCSGSNYYIKAFSWISIFFFCIYGVNRFSLWTYKVHADFEFRRRQYLRCWAEYFAILLQIYSSSGHFWYGVFHVTGQARVPLSDNHQHLQMNARSPSSPSKLVEIGKSTRSSQRVYLAPLPNPTAYCHLH